MSESPYAKPSGLLNTEWELEAAKTEIATLKLAVTVLKTENEILDGKVVEREKKNMKLTTELEQVNKRLQDAIKIYKANEKELQERISFLETEVDQESKELEERIKYLENKLATSSEQLQLRESTLEVREKELKEKERELKEREEECERVKDFFAAGNDVNGLILDMQGRVKRQEEELKIKEQQIISLRVKLEISEQERLALQQTFRNHPPKEKETPPPLPKPRSRSMSHGSPSSLRKRNTLPARHAAPDPEPQHRWSFQQPINEDHIQPTIKDRIYDDPEPLQLPIHEDQEQQAIKDRIYDDPNRVAPDYNKLGWEPSCAIDSKRKIVGGVAVYSQKEGSLYFSSVLQQDILVYNADQKWEYIPPCPQKFFGLAIVEDNITAVGGQVRERLASAGEASAESTARLSCTNKLLSFTAGANKGAGLWVELYPPMPTKRAKPSAICSSHWLIVAGGDDGQHLPTVEVMDLANKQWYRAAMFPTTLAHPQMVLNESISRIYLTGEDPISKEQAMYNCTVGELLNTKEPVEESEQSTEESSVYEQEPFYTPSPLMLKASKVWKELPRIPKISSTIAVVEGQVMASGGIDKKKNISNEIYSLNVSNNRWEQVAHMPTARHKALMGYNQFSKKLVIIGGFTRMGPINTVDIANIKQ